MSIPTSSDVLFNLGVLCCYGTQPKPTGSFQFRLIAQEDPPTRIISKLVSLDALALDSESYTAKSIPEKKYGIRAAADIFNQMIPKLNEVTNIHLLTFANAGLLKLSNELKGEDKKALLRPLSDAIVAHINSQPINSKPINSQPKHRTAVPIKSALKIAVTEASLETSKKGVSFGTDSTLEITPQGNRRPIPQFVLTRPPKESVVTTQSPAPTQTPELPAIPTLEMRCAEILQRGKGLHILSDKMKDTLDDLLRERRDFISRNQKATTTDKYKRVVEAYNLRVDQLEAALIDDLAQRMTHPKRQNVYTGK